MLAYIGMIQCLHEGWQCVDRCLSLILPLSLHLCQHGGRAEVKQMGAMILSYYYHFIEPMDNGISVDVLPR